MCHNNIPVPAGIVFVGSLAFLTETPKLTRAINNALIVLLLHRCSQTWKQNQLS